jgi:hypothetical protein
MTTLSDFPNQFAGQYAVVTGGAQGLGEAIALCSRAAAPPALSSAAAISSAAKRFRTN